MRCTDRWMRDARWNLQAHVRRARRVRLPPVTSQVVTGYWLHEPADRSQDERKGIGSGDVVLALAQYSSPTLRSRPHLSIHLHYVLRVHSWSYTPNPHPPQRTPVIVHLTSSPIAFSGCTAMAARRPIPIESLGPRCLYKATCMHIPRHVRTGYQPGMLHGGCRRQI